MSNTLDGTCLEFASGRPCSEAGDVIQREAMGSSEPMRKVVAEVERVAPTDFTVLVTGETGSGKEVVARAIHRLSRRAAGPFVPVDCGSIPASLIESELFGHERGAFTGADRARLGKFELASGGTLFLDEISNLPFDVQPKLLRALQERKIWRVGGTQSIAVDIRVVAATNQDLCALVQASVFRLDLYHRLDEFSILVPPLRERGHDVLFLANRFLELTNRELKKSVRGLSEAAAELLLDYGWPGNVRELRNVIRRGVLLAEVDVMPDHLGIAGTPVGPDAGLLDDAGALDGSVPLREMVRRAVVRLEREILARALRQTGGNKAQAARLLQVDYKTIHKKTREYGILPS
jgi:two-component system nitrogen regulation response regulator GlnG